MNLRLYLQTLRWNRVRLAAVVVAAIGWGMLIPIIYVQFSDAFKELANSGAFPRELLNFGSGSLFTLPGALTLGLQHPLAIAFVSIFAIGSTVSADRRRAGGRDAGGPPLATDLAANAVRHAGRGIGDAGDHVLLALLAGQLIGVAIQGVTDELDLGLMPLVVLNGAMLWAAFAAFGLAASVTFDRHAPALGLSIAYLLVNYFLEILGSLWRDVAWSQQYSLFHHFNPGEDPDRRGGPTRLRDPGGGDGCPGRLRADRLPAPRPRRPQLSAATRAQRQLCRLLDRQPLTLGKGTPVPDRWSGRRDRSRRTRGSSWPVRCRCSPPSLRRSPPGGPRAPRRPPSEDGGERVEDQRVAGLVVDLGEVRQRLLEQRAHRLRSRVRLKRASMYSVQPVMNRSPTFRKIASASFATSMPPAQSSKK